MTFRSSEQTHEKVPTQALAKFRLFRRESSALVTVANNQHLGLEKARKTSAPESTNYSKMDESGAPITPIEHIYFTCYASRTINIKSDARSSNIVYLSVNEGELIKANLNLQPKRGWLWASTGKEQGYIMLDTFDIDIHVENPYLEATDIFLKQPALLPSFLESGYEVKTLIALLSARRIMARILKQQCELEYQHVDTKHDTHVLFREESPAMVLISTLIKHSDACKAFKKEFRQYVISLLNEVGHNLPLLLTKCITYLNNRAEGALPAEIIMVLKVINELRQEHGQDKIDTKLLGSIFFLRYLNIALLVPDADEKLQKPLEKQKLLTSVAKALQFISNQVDPGSNDLILFPLADELKALQQPVSDLLNKIARSSYFYHANDKRLLAEGADFYAVLLGTFQDHQDEQVRLLLSELKLRLGATPSTLNKIPLLADSERIAEFIATSRLHDQIVVCRK